MGAGPESEFKVGNFRGESLPNKIEKYTECPVLVGLVYLRKTGFGFGWNVIGSESTGIDNLTLTPASGFFLGSPR